MNPNQVYQRYLPKVNTGDQISRRFLRLFLSLVHIAAARVKNLFLVAISLCNLHHLRGVGITMSKRKEVLSMTARWAIGFVIFSALCVPLSAHAQDASSAVPTVPKMSMGRVVVRDIVAAIGRAANVSVVADKSVSSNTVEWKTSGGTLTDVLQELVALLPKGTRSRTVYLPKESAEADGDTVAQAAAASDTLLAVRETPKRGTVRVPVITAPDGDNPADAVEILGKKLTGAKAQAAIAALDLKPVYLLTKPSPAGDPVAKYGDLAADVLRLWSNMTPEQRMAAADNQFDALFNMESVARRALIGQQMQVGMAMAKKMQALPADQRDQFMAEIMESMPKPPAPPAKP